MALGDRDTEKEPVAFFTVRTLDEEGWVCGWSFSTPGVDFLRTRGVIARLPTTVRAHQALGKAPTRLRIHNLLRRTPGLHPAQRIVVVEVDPELHHDWRDAKRGSAYHVSCSCGRLAAAPTREEAYTSLRRRGCASSELADPVANAEWSERSEVTISSPTFGIGDADVIDVDSDLPSGTGLQRAWGEDFTPELPLLTFNARPGAMLQIDAAYDGNGLIAVRLATPGTDAGGAMLSQLGGPLYLSRGRLGLAGVALDASAKGITALPPGPLAVEVASSTNPRSGRRQRQIGISLRRPRMTDHMYIGYGFALAEFSDSLRLERLFFRGEKLIDRRPE